MTDQTVYRVTFLDGSSCHYGVASLANAAAGKTGRVEEITVKGPPDLRVCTGDISHDVRADVRANDIDDRYAGRLAIMLECMLIDSHGFWNEAASLLDEYKSEWNKSHPQPPTFMGEPMPPDRKARLIAMNVARECAE